MCAGVDVLASVDYQATYRWAQVNVTLASETVVTGSAAAIWALVHDAHTPHFHQTLHDSCLQKFDNMYGLLPASTFSFDTPHTAGGGKQK